jgi:hypothetical protein
LEPPRGGSGNASAGDTASSDGGSGTDGGSGGGDGGTSTSGSSGAAGSDGGDGPEDPPKWHLVGDDSLAVFFSVGELFDFELGPNGRAYLAFRGCVSCDNPPQTSVVPTVLELSGGEWSALPTGGLVATDREPRLTVTSDGTLLLLNDDSVRAFDGSTWTSALPALPGTPTFDGNLTLAPDTRAHVTLRDGSSGDARVVGEGASDWQDVGSPFASDALGLRVSSGGGGMCLVHTLAAAAPEEHVQVRCFDGDDWVERGAFPGESAEILSDGSAHAYLAILPDAISNVTVQELANGTWSPLAPLPSSVLPSLAIGGDGVLHAAYLRELTYVNIARWEGGEWADVPYPFGDAPYTASSEPALRLRSVSGRSVPHVAFRSGMHLRVMAYD